ncbi:glycosyltransferase family A protein [Aquabacterium sp.]|uniref:glycosyltransferase family 2 protein n=1 Tax=Aquabacterium sp. TaxID=1872578 RepID=UPI0025C33109|nr:glycosyltransferase family A protein [Aquabacterium sp.]
MTGSGVPAVTVIIPAYNAAPYIGETIEHVLGQTLPDIEVIVVDDGSSDQTADVVALYPSVRYIRKVNGGVSSARNVGARQARARWISFVDADDLWHPQMLASMLELMLQHPTAAMGLSGSTSLQDRRDLSSPIQRIDGALPFRFLSDFREVFRFPYLGMSSVIVERDRFLALGGFNENLRRAEDVDLFLRLLYNSPGYVRLMYPAVHIRTVDGSLSSDSIAGYVQLLDVYQRFLAEHESFAQESPRLVRQTLSDLHLRLGRALFRADRRSEAKQQALASMRKDFTGAALALLLRVHVPPSWLAVARWLTTSTERDVK